MPRCLTVKRASHGPLCVVLAFFALSCAGPTPPPSPPPVRASPSLAVPPTDVVTGRVLHLRTGVALPGALVILRCGTGQHERLADAAGVFTFSVEPGPCTIQVLLGRANSTVSIDPIRPLELRIDPDRALVVDVQPPSEADFVRVTPRAVAH